jgi:imidazolonepropionase-like amidohydrolase
MPSGATVVDLGGRYLLPGLIDAHVHVASIRQAEVALRSGVTTLRSMGVAHFADVGLRELGRGSALALPEVVAAGYHVGPQLESSAFFLDEPGLARLLPSIRGPASFREVTAANLKRKVDWIKVTATARAGLPGTDPREQTMTEAEVAAVVEEARKTGIPVAAHAHGDEGGRAAVSAGVRSIEHGTYLSEGTLTSMKEKGTYLVPTVAVVQDLVEPGGDYDNPTLRNRGRHMLPRIREVVATAKRIGVKLVAATDTSYGPESTLRLSHEVEELVRSGLAPLEAIRSATSTAAELLRMGDRTGTIKAGLEADLIVVDRNPLDDVVTLQDLLLVMSNGKIVVNRLNLALPTSAPSP